MGAFRGQVLSATGDVPGAATAGAAKFILTPAGAVATLTVKEGGGSGTEILTLQAAADGSSVEAGPIRYQGQLHVTLAGEGATVTVGT